MTKHKNEVTLSGRIIKMYTPKPQRLLLRLHAGDNIPECFVCDWLADFVMCNYKVGDYITLRCNLQSTRKEKIGRAVTVFINSVYPTKKVMQNNFEMVGEIRSIYVGDLFTTVCVGCVTEYKSTVPILIYNRRDIDKSFAVGDTVTVKGEIQTKKCEYKEKSVYHQNYVCKQIKKV